jgi:hypothetical protein
MLGRLIEMGCHLVLPCWILKTLTVSASFSPNQIYVLALINGLHYNVGVTQMFCTFDIFNHLDTK